LAPEAERVRAITFDYGQTIAELDHDFLAQRVAEFGGTQDPRAAERANTVAWQAYGELKSSGHAQAWRQMMRQFLIAGGAAPAHGAPDPQYAARVADWLWEQQPTRNLWRKPIPGMFELVESLAARGVPVGIISNSEGYLAELLAELDWSAPFRVVADSGRLGFEKPGARIFEYTADELGVSVSETLHVGDAWEADVIGATAAGARAVWFAENDGRALPARVSVCQDAAGLSAILTALGIPL